jgi:hypothetical protein
MPSSGGLPLASIKLDSKTVYDAPLGGRPTNVFTMYTGGSRYGTGRFLMTASDYIDMEGDAADGTVNLEINGPPGPGVLFQVVLAGAVPYLTGPSQTDQSESVSNMASKLQMVEAIVFDLRAQLTNPITCALNVQQQGFPYSGSTPQYYTETTNSNTPWQWSDVCGQLVDYTGNPIDPDIPNPPTTWNPRNLIYDGIATNKVIDDLCSHLFIVAGFTDDDYDTMDLYESGKSIGGNSGSDSGNTSTLSDAHNYIIDGTDFERNDTRFPSMIGVQFKVFDTDHANDPYTNFTALPTSGNNTRCYEVDVNSTLTSGSQNFIMPLTYGNYVGIFSGGSVSNTTELTAVANDLGARKYKSISVNMSERRYAGIWPFVPDGLVRGIQWVCNANGAVTTIRFNDERDFCAAIEPIRAVEAISSQLVIGLGQNNSAPNPGGTRFFWAAASQVVPIRFTTPTATQANYNGFIQNGTTTGGPPGGMTDGQACIICNLPDLTLSTLWPVTSGTYSFGLIVGSTTGGGGSIPVIWSETPPTENCS